MEAVVTPDRLNLTLPTQSSHVDPTLPLSVRELDAWIRNLPTADVAATTRQVFQAIVGTNGCRLPPELRSDLLDRYANQIGEIREALQPHFVGQPHPLPQANRRIVSSLEKLLRTLATGREIIAREASGELAMRGVGEAVRALRDAISVGYLGYQLPAPGVWQELHELYRFGTREDPTDSDAWQESYKEALLLELADPNRLTPAELQLTTATAQALARHAQLLHPAAQADGSGSLHVVAFAADSGPAEPGDYDLQRDPQRGRLLDTSGVAAHLTEAMRCLAAGEPVELSEPLRGMLVHRNLPFLQRLATLYAQRPRRRHRRVDLDAEIEIVRGVSALHSMVNGPGKMAQEEDAISLSGDARSGVNLGAAAVYSADQWRQINSSAQGVGLLRGPGGQQRVQVGDLLGMKGLDGRDSWVPAIVRRLRYRNDDLVVGVQLIASKVHATLARYADPSGAPRVALLVQQRVKDAAKTLLISQRDALAQQQPLTLIINNREITAQPGALIESSDFFDIHELAPAKSP